MATATFTVTGMHCSSCSMLVTMNLEDLPGVSSVDCDHATGRTLNSPDQPFFVDGKEVATPVTVK